MPDEYISREAMLEHLDRCKQSEDATTLTAAVITALQCFVQSQPTADVAPVVHGQWVDNGIPDSILNGCSVCGFTCGSSSFFYCPKCGAWMDGGHER